MRKLAVVSALLALGLSACGESAAVIDRYHVVVEDRDGQVDQRQILHACTDRGLRVDQWRNVPLNHGDDLLVTCR